MSKLNWDMGKYVEALGRIPPEKRAQFDREIWSSVIQSTRIFDGGLFAGLINENPSTEPGPGYSCQPPTHIFTEGAKHCKCGALEA